MIIEFADNQGNAQALDLENIGNKAFNVDCMNVLKKLPDKCFDLAIVDPPYGDALDDEERGGGVLGTLWRVVRPLQESGNDSTAQDVKQDMLRGGVKAQLGEQAEHGQASTVKKS